MNKLRVAVTGGSGEIGSRLVRYLSELGHTVFNIDQREPCDASGTYCRADLRQRAQIQPIFEKVDAVCHLGEIPGIPPYEDPGQFFAHNTSAGSTVFHLSAEAGVKRLIYTSSCQVYGMWGEPVIPPRRLPLDETHPLQPSNVYACGKVANEYLVEMLARTRGLSVAIFRFPGVWPDGEEKARWLPWLDGRDELCDGCGTYVGMSDAVRAYALALEHPRPGCEAYHFSFPEIAATMPLSQLIKKHPGFPNLPADWPELKSPVNCAKAKEHFGWEPRFNILEAFREKFGRDPRPPNKPALELPR